MITKPIDDIAERLTAVEALFTAQLTTRHIKRALKHFTDQDDTELQEGILTIVSAGEAGYKNQKGMVAKEGTGKILLVAHIRVAESNNSQDIEDAELAFFKEVKVALRVDVPGLGFALESFEHSRQLEHPYGWFVATIKVGPPRNSLS